MAVLPKNESREELRRRLIEEAEEQLRNRQLPPVQEVLADIRRSRKSPPQGLRFPDSTTLLRESRGSLDDPLPTLEEYVVPAGDLDAEQTRDPADLRRWLIEEAEERLRREPKPPLEEVLAEILQDEPFRPADFGAPDSTTLLREERER